ncbi:cilia- and flagella-associated protein 184-like [Chironomus tepperi]|uniref:cilia- and flagella-associated protein 184-like n=1 Tax=Chironomus tepperi TaxID=113505 RepID=UPI00391F7E84
MENSNNFDKSRISNEILSILKQARDQSRSSKSNRVTFNVPKIESIHEKYGKVIKPQKSVSLFSKSVLDLTKPDNEFRRSNAELRSRLEKFEAKGDALKNRVKKKPKRRIRKVTYRLKKPKPRSNFPPIEIPELEDSDRPILIKHFKEIILNFNAHKRRNRILRRKLRRYLIQKKVKKAFRNLSERKENEFKETYYKNLARIYELKQEIKLMKEAYDVEKLVKMKKKDELIGMKNACIQVYAKALEVETAHPISERAIKRLLNKFHKFYNEVSNLRMSNFKTQQLIAKFVDKEKKIEEIGDGITLFEYENTKTRLQIINSNIEAKNKILERMRMRIRRNIKDGHKCSHDLKELDIDLQQVDENLNKLKAEHAKLFNESQKLKKLEKQLDSKLNDIYVKGQLLSERCLMLDYDKMDEKFNVKKDEVERLKNENQKLDQKLRKYEEELKNLVVEKGKAQKNVEPLSLYEERVTLFRKTRTS